MVQLDWSNLKFGYIPTNYNVRCYYRNGKWGEIEVSSETTINIHMAATCLHYGQEAFEGLKAHGCKDGKAINNETKLLITYIFESIDEGGFRAVRKMRGDLEEIYHSNCVRYLF